MICPYCNKEMIEGLIRGDRYRLKWHSKSKSSSMIFLKKSDLSMPVEYDHKGIVAFFCPVDEIFMFKKIKE